MFIFSSLLPYDISKWLYVSYNNPYLIFLSHDKMEIGRMMFVYGMESSIFMVANWLVFRRSGR